VAKYEAEARKNWDVFYKNHQDNFFKDRHYLAKEFPHIFPEGLIIGSGVGGGGDGDGGDGGGDGGGSVEEGDGEDDDGVGGCVGGGDDGGSVSCDGGNVVNHANDEHERGPAARYSRPTGDASAARPRVFLEVGCGVGNTAFPLLAADPTAVVYCCDFSARAVDLVRQRAAGLPADQAARIHPFVCDITCEALTDHVPAGSVDVTTMVGRCRLTLSEPC
jgi:hypothetical protein